MASKRGTVRAAQRPLGRNSCGRERNRHGERSSKDPPPTLPRRRTAPNDTNGTHPASAGKSARDSRRRRRGQPRPTHASQSARPETRPSWDRIARRATCQPSRQMPRERQDLIRAPDQAEDACRTSNEERVANGTATVVNDPRKKGNRRDQARGAALGEYTTDNANGGDAHGLQGRGRRPNPEPAVRRLPTLREKQPIGPASGSDSAQEQVPNWQVLGADSKQLPGREQKKEEQRLTRTGRAVKCPPRLGQPRCARLVQSTSHHGLIQRDASRKRRTPKRRRRDL